ncbi:hypothetical protein LguiA_035426 [Lonicera macranthoides]
MLFPQVLLASAIVLSCFPYLSSGATLLPSNEVEALGEIAKTLGKKDWNFSVDPCGGEEGWSTKNPVKGFENAVTCDCSFFNNTVCHIVSM